MLFKGSALSSHENGACVLHSQIGQPCVAYVYALWYILSVRHLPIVQHEPPHFKIHLFVPNKAKLLHLVKLSSSCLPPDGICDRFHYKRHMKASWTRDSLGKVPKGIVGSEGLATNIIAIAVLHYSLIL